MANYPANLASLPTVTRRTKFSVGWANNLIDEFKAVQSGYEVARYGFSTLASFLAVNRTSDGIWINFVTHGHFVVSANMHHLQTHATIHVNGTDNLPLASVTRRGLLTSIYGAKLVSCAASSTRNLVLNSTYVGAGGGRLVTLGFAANSVRLLRDTTADTSFSIYAWQWHRNVSSPVAESDVNHRATGVADISFNVSGFHVTDAANVNNQPYRFIAMG